MILRRRWARRPLRIKRAPSTGGFYVKRRCPAFGIVGSQSVAGLVTSGNNALFALGTPVAAASGAANVYDVPFAMTFYLNQLDGYTDITNIADKYRIVNAYIKLVTQNQAGSGFTMPWIEWITDHDDSSTPSISQVTQKMGVRTTGFNQRGQLGIFTKPLPAVNVYNGVSAAYLVPRRSPYINTEYSGVPHYAVKGVLRGLFLSGNAYATNMAVDVRLTVHAKDLQ